MLKEIKKIITEDKNFIIIVMILGFAIHLYLWVSHPLHYGPDGKIYIYYFIDFFSKNPLFPAIQTYRMPIAPLFYGCLLKAGGVLLVSIISEILALILIPIIYIISSKFDKLTARIATVLFIFMFPYQIQFHQISSDALFSFNIILFFLVLIYGISNTNELLDNKKNVTHKKIFYWAILGILTATATLTRPSGLVLIITLPVIFFLKLRLKEILKLVGVYSLALFILLGSFIGYKAIRFNDFSLARGTNYREFMRIYNINNPPLLNPDNGPNSKKLVSYIEKFLLTTDLYKKYNITLDKILNYKPNRRFFEDIVVLVDRVEGWNSNYKLLRNTAIESIKTNLKSYLLNYTKDIIKLALAKPPVAKNPTPYDNIVVINDIDKEDPNKLPTPDSGELIPYSYIWWDLSRPDSTLPTEKEINEFNYQYKKIANELDNVTSEAKFTIYLEKIWDNIYIPILFFWVFGFYGIYRLKGPKRILIILLILIPIFLITGTLYGEPLYVRYRLPVDPLLIIAGSIGLATLLKKH